MYCECDNEVYPYDSNCDQDGDEIIHTYFYHCHECGRYWKHIERFMMIDYWDEEMERD